MQSNKKCYIKFIIHDAYLLNQKCTTFFQSCKKRKKKTYFYDCIDGAEQKNARTLLNLDEIIYGN